MENLNWKNDKVISLIMNQMTAGFILVEYPSGKILEYNKASEEILEHSVFQASDVTEYSAYGGIKPNGERYQAEEYPTARALLHGEIIHDEEMVYITPNQKKKVISVSATPIVNDNGERISALCIFNDITERKKSEDKVAELLRKEKELSNKLLISNGQIKTLLEESPFGVALFDSDGRYLHLNAKLSAFNGVEINHHLGKTPGQLFGEAGITVDRILKEVQFTKKPSSDIIIETATPAHPLEIRTYNLHFYPVHFEYNIIGVGFFASDITEKKAEELEKEKLLIKTFNEKEQITQFINILSHDIRSPLSAIKLNSQMILRNLKNEASLVSLSHKISNISERVDNLITDILDVNLIKTGAPLELNRTNVKINNLVQSIVENYQSLHGDIFTLHIEATQTGYWSSSAIERVVDNLISNAVKYSFKGSPIIVNTFDIEEAVVFEVRNTGPIIPAEMHEQIFIPYKKLNNNIINSRSYGLGLAIVKGLIEAHKGTITLTSDLITGTTFKVILPI